MLFRHNRPEYTDGEIDLIPIHIGAPNRELGFGHEQVWRITLHNDRREIGQISYRDGESRCVYYYGHIGYHIDPGFRGSHYAYKACRLIENEIRTLKEICGDHILKVIIETCMLTDEEKVKLCEIVTFAGADFIKTSTGFGGGGATFDDVDLMVKNVGDGVKVKASGGISGLEDAEKFLEIGAKRLGTSRVVKAAKAAEK